MSIGACIFWLCVVTSLIVMVVLLGLLALRAIDNWLDGLIKAKIKRWFQ